MKTILIKIKEFFRKIINFFNINPHKHWNVLLLVFFVLTVLLISFSLYILFEIKNDKIFQTKIIENENRILLKEDLLEKTMESFNVKERGVLNLDKIDLITKDPSI